MPYNASDRKQIRAAEKAQQRADQMKTDFLKSCLSSPGGRQWFYDLLESCHMFSDPWTGNPYTEAAVKGERNVGLRIYLDIMQNCPDQYITMWREANGRRTELDAAVNPDRTDSGEYAGSPDFGRDTQGSEPRDYDN